MDLKQSKPIIKFKSNKIKKMLIEKIQFPNPEHHEKDLKTKGQKRSKKDKTKSMRSLLENCQDNSSNIKNFQENQRPKVQFNQKQVLRMVYQVLFRQKSQNQQTSIKSQQSYNQIMDDMIEQILRLHQIEEDYLQFNRLLQKSVKKNTNQQKWKVVVLTYKQKLKKYDNVIDELNFMQQQLRKTIDVKQEQINRLTYMNNIKFQKINTLVEDVESSQQEIQEITQQYAQVQGNLTILRQKNEQNMLSLDISMRKNEKLQKQLQKASHELQELTNNFNEYKQKTIIAQNENNPIKSNMNILTQQCQTQRQIRDLKEKYQNQIDLLQNKVRSYLINQEELELQILELQASLKKRNMVEICQSYAQTEEQNTIKGCYFSTLAQEFQNNESLDDYNQFDQNQLQLNFNQQREQENVNDQHNNQRYKMSTQRQRQSLKMDRYSEPDEQDYRSVDGKSIDLSFEEKLSMNNASRYTQSLQELSSQLGEAYQKINDLNSKLEQIQSENRMLRKKEDDKILSKAKGGLLSSFFKK